MSVSSSFAPDWLTPPADANDLVPGVWPSSASRSATGEVEIAGIPVSDLARTYGTPLYVVDEDEVRARARAARPAFDAAASAHGTTAHVYYAGKALLTTEVARWVTEEGLALDVCSAGELAVALAAGVDPRRLGYHGNNKSAGEITRAVEVGVASIIIDSDVEIERVATAATAAGVVQSVRLRVNSGVHAETHDFLATAHEDQKFGFTLCQAPAAVARIRAHASLDFGGLHCHIGSQIFGTAGFRESAARLLELHEELSLTGPVPILNLGGGFGIAYTRADRPTPLTELAEGIIEVVAHECARRGIPIPTLAFEPGRSIVGTAGVTLYTVGTTKPVVVDTPDGERTRLYVSVDGGMSDNARHALYGAHYSARVVSRASQTPPTLTRIVGMHCESGDIVVDAEYLPGDVAPGDLLAVPATGAYCFSLASSYNWAPRPPVIAVRSGEARTIVRAITVADLLSFDAGARTGGDLSEGSE